MRAEGRLPNRAGVGFKPEHFSQVVAHPQPLGFFEVHAENYMGAGGTPHAQLARLRRDYAISVHGVGLSIGSDGPLDKEHLIRLRDLCARYEPEAVSEHLAWSTLDGLYLNDLLPLPYTEETLARVVRHVDEVQSALRRQVLIENPATYVQFSDSYIPEPEFLDRIATRTGCGLLLDLNNVVVSCRNHSADPLSYLKAYPVARVAEIHLAGHNNETDDAGAPLLIDAHGSLVTDEVWALYRHVVAARGQMPTLIEWDNDLPAWPVLLREALRAQEVLDGVAKAAA